MPSTQEKGPSPGRPGPSHVVGAESKSMSAPVRRYMLTRLTISAIFPSFMREMPFTFEYPR